MTEENLPQSPYGRFLYHAARGELAFQRDAEGRAFFPPRLVSPKDGSEPSWCISAGKGSIHSLTLVRHKGEAPLPLALVDLDEGFRMMSNIVTDAPESLRIGDRVSVTFRSLAEGQPPLPVFVREGEAA